MIFDKHLFPGTLACLTALLAFSFAAPAWAQQREAQAHVHGRLTLDLVVDGASIVIAMASPLDNLVGFERAPGNAAERKAAADAIDKLRAADDLFTIDAAANCKPGPVDLRSAALGAGKPDLDGKHGAHEHRLAAQDHADLEAIFAFNCANAAAARFIDLAFFTSFRSLQQIDVQIAAPQGQFTRTLKRPNLRLAWGK